MDESDLKIIEILKKNARIGYSDISLEIGLSTPTIRDTTGSSSATPRSSITPNWDSPS